MKTSKAQLKANKKYKDNNPGKQQLYVARSTAKRFIKELASLKDLDDLTQLIEDKRQELKEDENNETKDNSN